MTELRLLLPHALWLLLLVPLPLLLARTGPARRLAAWRVLALLVAVLALARPVHERASDREHHVLVLDASASVDPRAADGARALAVAWRDALPSGAAATLVTVGGEAPELAATARPTLTERGRSPLADALAQAALAIPDGARGAITLASDGADTDGGWDDVVADLGRRALPLHVVPLATAGGVRPVGLQPLAHARVGAGARLLARLSGSPPAGARVDVALVVDGRPVWSAADVEVEPDGARLLIELEPRRAGFLPFALTVSGPDVADGASTLTGTLPVDDALRVLYVGPAGPAGEERRAALQRLVGPGLRLAADPPTAGALDEHELVLLDDRPAGAWADGLAEGLARAVRDDGLGLFACGARQAFGAGGWQDTALAEVLPIEAVQKEEKRDPSVALAIVIDTSGSMGGNRVQLAKETARLAMRRLLPHDKVGIVEFYGSKRWAAPLQPASNNIELERALNRLAAGGGTVILPAIEEAFYGLLNVDARYKHVLVLTDGGVESGAFEPLLRRMASRGITTSTVLIGGDAHSEFLVTLANWGKGRFYSVPDRFNLPEILFKQPTSAKLSGVRPGVAPLRAGGGPGWWGDVDPAAVPAVAGLVETELRPGAEDVLSTVDGARPVLSSWRYGLGRVTAMPTEPVGPGTDGFEAWQDYGRFLARALERTARDLAPFAFEVRREGRDVRVVAVRRTSQPLEPWAARLGADGGATPLEFEQRAPDRFEARLWVAPAEALAFEGGAAQPDGSAPSARRRFVAPARAEGQVAPEDVLDLAGLARATGGAVLATGAGGASPAPAALLRVGGSGTARALVEWRPWLVGLVLCVYFLDLLDRRRPRRPRPTPR